MGVSGYKRQHVVTTVGDAVASAFEALGELEESVQGVVDSAPEPLAESERIVTFREAADELRGLEEIEVPDELSALPCGYDQWVPYSRKRNVSRQMQVQNVVLVLGAVLGAITEGEDAAGERGEEVEQFESEIEYTIDILSGISLPGIYS